MIIQTMRENINKVSSGEIIGEAKESDKEEEEEEKLLNISTGEVENE